MTEHGTFSALVDDVLARSLRKDRLQDVIAYARATIRECLVLSFFDQDLIEDQIVADATPFLWARPQKARALLVVRYNQYDRRNNLIVGKERKPGQADRNDTHYFYMSGNSYVIAGATVGETLDIAYYAYASKFKYYSEDTDKPAQFDADTELWTYHDNYDDTEVTQLQARELVSHWLLFHWFDLIVEGTLAKLYKQVGDARSKAAYGLYKSMQNDLKAGESQSYVGRGRSS